MTDILPLVKRAWGKSFALQENVRHAIVERGWGPLNYVLLDHPDVRKGSSIDMNSDTSESINNTNNSNDSNTVAPSISVDLSAINTSSGYAGIITDAIIVHHLKDSAKVKSLQLKKEKINEISDLTEKLKAICKKMPSSGAFASVGEFCLTPNVMAVVVKEKKGNKTKTTSKNNGKRRNAIPIPKNI